MTDLSATDLDRAARSFMNWSYEEYDVLVRQVAEAAGIPATVVAANMAAISLRAGELRAQEAQRIKRLRIRIEASKRGAETRKRRTDAGMGRG